MKLAGASGESAIFIAEWDWIPIPMLLTKVHKSKNSVFEQILSNFWSLYFTLKSRGETLSYYWTKKLYISWKQCTWLIKASDRLLQVKFSAKEEAVSYPQSVWKEKRTKWPLSCVIAHNVKLAVVVVTTGTGTICSLWDITSASFLYNAYNFVRWQLLAQRKETAWVYLSSWPDCGLTHSQYCNCKCAFHCSCFHCLKKSKNVYKVST